MRIVSKRAFKIALASLAVLVIVIAGGAWYTYRQLGDLPNEKEIASYRKLPYFSNGEFQSPSAIEYHPDKITGGEAGFLRFFLRSKYAPSKPFHKVQLKKSSFASKPQDFAMYWLGHSSMILELDGSRVLIDPVFGNAAPIPGIARRYDEAPLRREDLPKLDFVLITHDHFDHLEADTMRFLKDRDTRFIVPLGVGARLRSWGISEKSISELGWGESYKQNGLSFTAEKGIHYSSRSTSDRNKSLWASYVINGTKKIFWSGDTGYGQHFAEIGKKHGPFDLAAIEIDGWNEGWPKTHMFPKQVVQAHKEVNAKYLLPVHWGVFDLALHPWNESIEKVVALAEAEKVAVLTPMMGEKLVPGETQTSYWWRKEVELPKIN